MIITYLRSSSYNCWSICQQQYFLTYVLGKPSPTGFKAEKGTILHKVMETLANCKLCLQNGTTSFVDDSIGEVQANDKLYSDEFVLEIFERTFKHYVEKSIHKAQYTNKIYDEILEWCRGTLSYYGGMFDPRKSKIVEPEPHFDLEINEPWATYNYKMPNGEMLTGKLHIKGTIDLVTEVSPTHYEVIDYKSGQCLDWSTFQPKTYECFCRDPQLRLYHLALKSLYPHVKTWALTINYVRTDGPFTVLYDDDDAKDTMKMLRRRFEEIKNCVRPKLKSANLSHRFCKYVCHYGKTCQPGTNIPICTYIANNVRKHGIDKVIEDETTEGFNVGYYQNPGE